MYRRRIVLTLFSLLNLIATLANPLPARATYTPGSDAAWAAVRAKVPRDRPIFRPTWLPERFRQPGQAQLSGPFTGVTYRSDAGDTLSFVAGGSNSCVPLDLPVQTEPLLVHGVRGNLNFAPPSCQREVSAYWLPLGPAVNYSYSIQSQEGPTSGPVSREEMLRIVAGLVRIEPDGQIVSPLTYSVGGTCFPQTNLCIAGPFRAYFEAHGGVAINGYPLTEEIATTLEDGRVYQVQYFERTRLEFHPEHAGTPYEILLGQFGRRILAGVPGAPTAPVSARPGETFFAETGHNVGPRFGAYWQANGGLAQFGYPLTEAFEQRLENGQTYTVQYFERARFELHPEYGPPYDILLGQFGRQILATEPGR
jgi:hypothetical protein